MKRIFATNLSFAAIAFTLLSPQFVHARAMDDLKIPTSGASAMEPQEKAQLMVTAQATLTQTLDTKKAQPGQQLRVTLSKTVRLKDGTELPRGTQLIGTVVSSPANANSTSTLELRFTQAELKGGKVLPIKATIVGIYAPVNEGAEGIAGSQVPNTWNSQILEINQTEPLIGVELHSKIASENSGTLVSTTKSAVKLPAGSKITLAIAVEKSS